VIEPSPETLGLLADLIGFDSVSARSNRALIEHAAAYLASFGIEAQVLPSPDGEKASLWATIGPAIDGGLVLSGHSDVVPVEGQAWSTDPFTMDIRDDRAFGRGTADMKGFIACALVAAPIFRDAGLRRPVHIALTYDEEVGCVGAPKLLDWLSRQSPTPAMALIGEPTSMEVVNAHKGILVVRVTITGVEAHSSLSHLGVSAIELAAQAVVLLKRIEAELAEVHHDDRFLPPRATISVNRIGGGTAMNILAGQTWFDWDLRSIPGVEPAAVLADFEARLEDEIIAPARAVHSAVTASISVTAEAPPLAPESDGAAEILAKRLLGTNVTKAVSYVAEAGQYQQAGMSSILLGPGSIDQAHKADEFVALEQIARCEDFLARLAKALGSEA
jgi:acetylornithine deacetylase